MFKKLLVPLTLALLAALAIAGVAYAAARPANTPDESSAAQKLRAGLGQITAIGDSQFTVQLKNGGEKVIRVDADTRYVKADGSAGSFADLQVGLWVAVAAKQLGDGSYLAVRVAVRAKPQVDVKVTGRVTAIDTASFTIRARDGKAYAFQVTPETHFRSRRGVVKGLKDLRLGMGVGVAARDLGDGQLQALVVIARAR